MVWFANPYAVELFFCMGDQGCVHLISFSVCQIGNIVFAIMKSPDNSASEA